MHLCTNASRCSALVGLIALGCPGAAGPEPAHPAPSGVTPSSGPHSRESGDRESLDEVSRRGTMAPPSDPGSLAATRRETYCKEKPRLEALLRENPSGPKAERLRLILAGPELKDCP